LGGPEHQERGSALTPLPPKGSIRPGGIGSPAMPVSEVCRWRRLHPHRTRCPVAWRRSSWGTLVPQSRGTGKHRRGPSDSMIVVGNTDELRLPRNGGHCRSGSRSDTAPKIRAEPYAIRPYNRRDVALHAESPPAAPRGSSVIRTHYSRRAGELSPWSEPPLSFPTPTSATSG